MRLKKDFRISDFLSAVKKCNGEVYFNTPEGDNLALRSVFCQYIFCSLEKTSDTFYEAEIVLEQKDDFSLLQEFVQN